MIKSNNGSSHNDVASVSPLLVQNFSDPSLGVAVIDLEHDNCQAVVCSDVCESTISKSDVMAISPVLPEPVKGPRNVEETAVGVRPSTPPHNQVPIAQSPVLLEPVTGPRNVQETAVGIPPSTPPHTELPIAQSPALLEPATGPRNVGETAVGIHPSTPPHTDVPIAQSPALLEPVTGPRNEGDGAALHAPQATTADTASSPGHDVLMFLEDDCETGLLPFTVRRDDTDLSVVDYDSMSDSDTEPSQSPSITQDQGMGHAEGIVRSWSDYEVVGLKILRGEPTVEDIVCGITRQFFNENNQLKPGVFWSDLFSNKVIPNHYTNEETGDIVYYYENSTRATVPLFEWIEGKSNGDAKFAEFPLSDDAVSAVHRLQHFVLSTLMPILGFNPEVVRFEISGVSILLQPPVGGVSQVMHTDDYPHCLPGEWISLLFPCHPQRGTVFLKKQLSDAFGAAMGVKPFFNIGDVAAWSGVKHFGSGADAVPPHFLLRSALFVFVHVTPLTPLLPQNITPVPGENVNGNRDEQGQEIIHYGPDEIYWTAGLVPIIRVCVCCLNGVNCDYEAQSPSTQNNSGQLSTSLLFCTQCAALEPLRDGQARVRSLICQWCKDNDTFYPVGAYPDMDTSNPTCVVSYLYESVLNAQLCTHGKRSYQPLPVHDLLFVLFSHEEIASSCKFWLDFFSTYNFTEVYAPIDFSQNSGHWQVFWELFLSNSACTRARILCWIGAIIAGIGPVFSKKDKLYHGGYPVFFDSKVCHRDAASNAFVNVLTSCESGVRFAFNEARWLKLTRRIMSYVKQTHWEYSMRCKCNATCNVEKIEGMHRQIKFCSGPILRSTVTQTARVVESSERHLVDLFVLKCRRLWAKRRGEGGS